MTEFIITFRESLEAALIVGIIFTIVYKQGLGAQIRSLLFSVVLAVLSSAVLGVALYHMLEHVSNKAFKELLESIFMYITAGLLMYVIFWMSKTMTSHKAISDHTTMVLSKGRKWGLFFLVFFAILREGFETALFLVANASIHETFSYTGFFSGIVLAVLVGYWITVQGRKIKLRPLFKYTSLLLVFFSAGMIAYGTHELHEFAEGREKAWMAQAGSETASMTTSAGGHTESLDPRCEELMEHMAGNAEEEEEYAFTIFPTVTDKSKASFLYTYDKDCGVYVHLLNSDGLVGGFLNGLLGYNSSPTWAELILWVISIAVGLFVWRRAYRDKKPAQQAAAR